MDEVVPAGNSIADLADYRARREKRKPTPPRPCRCNLCTTGMPRSIDDYAIANVLDTVEVKE